MQEQQVKFVRAAAFKGLFRRHPEILGELIRRPQARVREARETLRAVPLAGIKIMPHCADAAVGIPREAGQGAAEHFIGGAVAIDIGGHEGADAAVPGVLNDLEEAFFRKGFTKMHVTSATPGAVSRARQIHNYSAPLNANGPPLAMPHFMRRATGAHFDTAPEFSGAEPPLFRKAEERARGEEGFHLNIHALDQRYGCTLSPTLSHSCVMGEGEELGQCQDAARDWSAFRNRSRSAAFTPLQCANGLREPVHARLMDAEAA